MVEIKMAFGYSFEKSPFMARRDRVFSRRGGRPRNTLPGTIGGGVTDPSQGYVGEQAEHTQTQMELTASKSPYAKFLESLTKPIEYKSRAKERWNLARGQIQGATKLEAEQMKTYMGGKGFRGGESGIADTALGRVARGGSERLSEASRMIALSEADRAQQYEMMNLQRLLGGGQLALGGEEGAYNRLMDYYRNKLGGETGEWTPYWQGLTGGG